MPEELNITDEEMYKKGLDSLRVHSEEMCRRVIKSREEGKGNRTYIEDEDFMREMRIADDLEALLWRLRQKLDGYPRNEGQCGVICSQCPYIRMNFHHKSVPNHWGNESDEGWHCQVECECK